MRQKGRGTLTDRVTTQTARTLDVVIAALPENERAMIEVRARELIAEEMSLRTKGTPP